MPQEELYREALRRHLNNELNYLLDKSVEHFTRYSNRINQILDDMKEMDNMNMDELTRIQRPNYGRTSNRRTMNIQAGQNNGSDVYSFFSRLFHIDIPLGVPVGDYDSVPVPLPRNILEQINVNPYAPPETNQPNDKCSICLEEYNEGDRVSYLQCSHNYHENCINRSFQLSPRCPICRQDIRTYYA